MHHQAIAHTGSRVIASAVASDGIIEAIEIPERRFAIGVQWHPEYGVGGGEQLFAGLIRAANDYRRRSVRPSLGYVSEAAPP